ncbi:MAG: phage portal protein [Clostridia bacterium]|nr:phage portal protein [Clostridia bacterium]
MFGKPRDTPELPDIQNNVRDSGTLFVFGQSTSGERVDEKSAMQIATVYACVRLLAESVASLPLHLYRVTNDEGGKEKARDHPLYKILYRQANPEMTSFSFREVMMTHLLLWGNAYAQIVRDGKNGVLGLYPLLPENVEIDRDDGGNLYYIYHAYTDEVPGENNKDIVFKREEILHIPGLGFNGLVGFSPIAMMKNALGTTLAVERYGSSFFRNGAQPSGVLEHPGVLKNPDRIRQNWSDVYGGANNAHKVAVLEEGMSYKPISLPPEDSQFLSTREFDVEEICRIFRVPPHLVQDLKRSTFNNIEHQGISFVQYTLMPWLERFEQAIIKDVLIEQEQEAYFPKFNVDGLLRGDYKSRMEGYAVGFSNGFLSPNDIRKLENMDPIPNGDVYVANGSYVLLKDIGAAYKEQGSQLQEGPKEENPEEKPEEELEEEPENRRHTERKQQRKAERRGGRA